MNKKEYETLVKYETLRMRWNDLMDDLKIKGCKIWKKDSIEENNFKFANGVHAMGFNDYSWYKCKHCHDWVCGDSDQRLHEGSCDGTR